MSFIWEGCPLYTITALGMLEVFGSWNKVAPLYEGAPFESEVERQLQDAMGEQEAIMIVARDTTVKTGFSPPGP